MTGTRTTHRAPWAIFAALLIVAVAGGAMWLSLDPGPALANHREVARTGKARGIGAASPVSLEPSDQPEHRAPLGPDSDSVGLLPPWGRRGKSPAPRRATLVLTAVPAGDVTAEDIESLAGLSLTIRQDSQRGMSWSGTFSDTGQIQFQEIPPGIWTDPTAQGPWQLTPTLRVKSAFAAFVGDSGSWAADLPVERSRTLSAIVRSESGRPVAGASVEIEVTRPYHSSPGLHFVHSEDDGTFEFACLGGELQSVNVFAPPFMGLRLEGASAQGLMEAASPAVITLRRGERIDLWLVRASGERVASGRVAVQKVGSGEGDGEPVRDGATVREDGHVRVTMLPQGTYEIRGYGAGGSGTGSWTLPPHTRVRSTSETSVQRLIVIPAPHVKGQILGASPGEALAVHISDSGHGPDAPKVKGWPTKLSVDPTTGRFEQTLPPGTYTAMAVRGDPPVEGTPPVPFELTTAPTTVTLEFSDRARLHGQVVEASTGEPAKGAEVHVLSLRPSRNRRSHMTLACDGEGRFTVPYLDVDQFGLEATSEMGISKAVTVDRSDGSRQRAPLLLKIEPSAAMELVVTEEGGRPIEGAWLQVEGAGSTRWAGPTDAKGSTSLEPSPPGGTYAISLRHRTRAPGAHARVTQSTLHRWTAEVRPGQSSTLALQVPSAPAGEVIGRLIDPAAAAPLVGAKVSIHRDGLELCRTLTDPEGRFLLQSSTAGAATIRVGGRPTGVEVEVGPAQTDLGDVPAPGER